MALQSRGVRKLFVSTLALSAGLSACDRATPVESDLGPAFAHGVPGVEPCGATMIGGGNKDVRVAVKFSNGSSAGAGIIVTLVSKQDGPQCYGETDANGVVLFTGIAKDKQIFVVARDEVTIDVAKLEVVPPIPSNLSLFDDAPSAGAPNRQAPVMLSGTACTTGSPWTWTSWSAKNGDPCVVPGPGFDLTITLGNATSTTTELTLVDPFGVPMPNVVVAALSPWNYKALGANQEAACDLAPWIVDANLSDDVCDDPDVSSGPALINAVDLTNAQGVVNLAHAAATPLVFEAIAKPDPNGPVFFATIDPSLGGPTTVQMAPGMCTIASVLDGPDPSVDVDIRYTQHSVGMDWVVMDDVPVPTPINNTLIVRTEVWASAAGGAGRYDLSWLVAGQPARSVRADFMIPAGGANAGTCPAFSWSGNGLSSVTTYPGYCAKSDNQAAADSVGKTAYTLYFIVSGVPTPLEDAWYSLTTVGDGVNASKSKNMRAGISFNDDPTTTLDESTLNRLDCPVRQNNDGRFGTFRLGNNDGRFGTF